MEESAFGVIHKGLSPKNNAVLNRVAYGEGAGDAPYALRRMDYASMKSDLRSGLMGRGKDAEHTKGQLKYLTSNPSAKKRKSGSGPRGKLP